MNRTPTAVDGALACRSDVVRLWGFEHSEVDRDQHATESPAVTVENKTEASRQLPSGVAMGAFRSFNAAISVEHAVSAAGIFMALVTVRPLESTTVLHAHFAGHVLQSLAIASVETRALALPELKR